MHSSRRKGSGAPLCDARTTGLAPPRAPAPTALQPCRPCPSFRLAQSLQAWEALDPPSGWDSAGPVLAAGFYQVSAAALDAAQVMDDALNDAVAAGTAACLWRAARGGALRWGLPTPGPRSPLRPTPYRRPPAPLPPAPRPPAFPPGDASLAQACVVAVSKVATMFATLVPPPSASDAPQPVLLRHNDLRYLANHLLLLPFLHSPELERLAGGEVWFGDDALRLRAQARALLNESVSGEALSPRQGLAGPGLWGGRMQRALGGMLALGTLLMAHAEATVLLVPRPSFTPCPAALPSAQLSVQQAALSEPLSQLLPLAAAAEVAAAASSSRGRGANSGAAADGPGRAVKQLLYTLERAGRLVWPTLPPGEALDFSARLLGPLFKALSDDILGMDDIGADECEGIAALCRPLVAGAPGALLAAVDGTGAQQGLEGAGVDVKALVRRHGWGQGAKRAQAWAFCRTACGDGTDT
jgi:hypothetical protein